VLGKIPGGVFDRREGGRHVQGLGGCREKGKPCAHVPTGGNLWKRFEGEGVEGRIEKGRR